MMNGLVKGLGIAIVEVETGEKRANQTVLISGTRITSIARADSAAVPRFTTLEALRTATINPARFLHMEDSLGVVGVGKVADLVLLDADPLADIRNTRRVHAVVANGRVIDAKGRKRLLDEQRRRAAGPPRPPADDAILWKNRDGIP